METGPDSRPQGYYSRLYVLGCLNLEGGLCLEAKLSQSDDLHFSHRQSVPFEEMGICGIFLFFPFTGR
jgi:hypothetical protein